MRTDIPEFPTSAPDKTNGLFCVTHQIIILDTITPSVVRADSCGICTIAGRHIQDTRRCVVSYTVQAEPNPDQQTMNPVTSVGHSVPGTPRVV